MPSLWKKNAFYSIKWRWELTEILCQIVLMWKFRLIYLNMYFWQGKFSKLLWIWNFERKIQGNLYEIVIDVKNLMKYSWIWIFDFIWYMMRLFLVKISAVFSLHSDQAEFGWEQKNFVSLQQAAWKRVIWRNLIKAVKLPIRIWHL